jgi:hypothetical protein
MEAGTPTCEMAFQIFATSFSWASQLMKFQDETAVNRDQKWLISIQFLGRNLFVSICPSSNTKTNSSSENWVGHMADLLLATVTTSSLV